MPETSLQLNRIQETIATLHLRVSERFPRSGLADLVGQVHRLGKEVEAEVERINRPHLGIRCAAFLVGLAIVGVLIAFLAHLRGPLDGSVFDQIQGLEAITSETVFLSAGFILLLTWETRIKRQRVIRAVRRLRELAHVVDMLQLTKDPDGVAGVSQKAGASSAVAFTTHSPRRDLSAWDLGRYLDYCSELLSLLSKLGYFYVARFDDGEATGAVNELEDLTNGLSRKIWQKIMILRAAHGQPPIEIRDQLARDQQPKGPGSVPMFLQAKDGSAPLTPPVRTAAPPDASGTAPPAL